MNSDHVTGKYGNTFLVLSEGKINYGTCIQHFSLDNFSTIIDTVWMLRTIQTYNKTRNKSSRVISDGIQDENGVSY